MRPIQMVILLAGLCAFNLPDQIFGQTIYVPQSAPYTNDAYTVLLEHFDGTTTGAITGIVTYTNGIFGQGACLNINDCIVYNMGALSQGTVEFWADADSFANNPDLTFVTAALWANNWSTFVIGVGQTNYVYSEYVDVNDNWQGMENGNTSKSVTTNSWHHYATTWGGKGFHFYVDGYLVYSSSATGGQYTATTTWQVGASSAAGNLGNGFNGIIDELRISDVQRVYAPAVPPAITGQPQSTTNNIGDNVSFSVVSTNTVPFTYQWYFDQNPVNGATNNSLSITNVQQENVGQYNVVVSDLEGSTTSSIANLNIPGVPGWINNGLVAYYPFNGNANDMSGNGYNGTAFAATLAADRFGNASSAYYFNGVNSSIGLPQSLANQLAGTNAVSVSVWFQTTPDTTNANKEIVAFGAAQTSQAFIVGTIFGDYSYSEWQGYYNAYSGVSVADGDWHQGSTIYDGTNVILYVDGVGKTSVPVISDRAATGAIIGASLTPATPEYWKGSIDDIRIYNVALTSNQVAQLYTFETSPVSITNQPQTVTNNLGDTVVLSVGVSGSNPQDYTWYFSGTNVDNGTNFILTIASISQPYFGNYYVVVTNAFSSVTSSAATIFEPATIIQQPANLVVPSQAPATFSVQAVGYPAPNYQWTLNGSNVMNGTNLAGPKITGANSNTLTIPSIQLSNTGNYQVLVSNSISTTNSSVAILNMSPSITAPFVGATPIWGTSPAFMVGAIGSGTLTYQWYFNGQPISGANYPQLNFNSIQFTNNGFYSVVITSPYGSVTNVAEQVAVNPAVVTLGFYPGLTIEGATGDSYIIQSSSNLANTNNWTTLTNLTLTQPVQLWFDSNVDASSPLNNQFFYRLIPQQ